LTEHVALFVCEPELTVIVAVWMPCWEKELEQVCELPEQAPDHE